MSAKFIAKEYLSIINMKLYLELCNFILNLYMQQIYNELIKMNVKYNLNDLTFDKGTILAILIKYSN
jgi:hypothetical protein